MNNCFQAIIDDSDQNGQISNFTKNCKQAIIFHPTKELQTCHISLDQKWSNQQFHEKLQTGHKSWLRPKMVKSAISQKIATGHISLDQKWFKTAIHEKLQTGHDILSDQKWSNQQFTKNCNRPYLIRPKMVKSAISRKIANRPYLIRPKNGPKQQFTKNCNRPWYFIKLKMVKSAIHEKLLQAIFH